MSLFCGGADGGVHFTMATSTDGAQTINKAVLRLSILEEIRQVSTNNNQN